MGCLNATVKVEPLPDNLTILETPKTPPETDHRLPLNARQVFRLKKNWKGIKRQLEVTGVEMFVRFVKVSFSIIRTSVKMVRQMENVSNRKYSNIAISNQVLVRISQDPSNGVTLQCQQPKINEFSFVVCKNISFSPSMKSFWFPSQWSQIFEWAHQKQIRIQPFVQKDNN